VSSGIREKERKSEEKGKIKNEHEKRKYERRMKGNKTYLFTSARATVQ
jgi:hypothetical protein